MSLGLTKKGNEITKLNEIKKLNGKTNGLHRQCYNFWVVTTGPLGGFWYGKLYISNLGIQS